jgi:hypothetical protein
MQIAGRDVLVRGRVVRIGRLEADGLDLPSNMPEVIGELRRARGGIDIFTFMQLLPHTQPQHSYLMEWDNVAALPVSTFDHWITKQIDFKVRNKARKGEKNGLSVREVPFDDALVRGISEIYNETPVRQGKAFWHYGKDLETVKRENSTFLESSILIGAFIQDSLVGFLKVVVDRAGGQASVMQILSMIKHRDKAPTNALIAQAVRSCADRKIPHIIYANFSYGKKERDSLADFKEANGFQRVEIPRYYVPLTLKGHAALRLGLHHRLQERIPAPVLARIRQARSRWYGRKLPVAKEAL